MKTKLFIAFLFLACFVQAQVSYVTAGPSSTWGSASPTLNVPLFSNNQQLPANAVTLLYVFMEPASAKVNTIKDGLGALCTACSLVSAISGTANRTELWLYAGISPGLNYFTFTFSGSVKATVQSYGVGGITAFGNIQNASGNGFPALIPLPIQTTGNAAFFGSTTDGVGPVGTITGCANDVSSSTGTNKLGLDNVDAVSGISLDQSSGIVQCSVTWVPVQGVKGAKLGTEWTGIGVELIP